MERIASSERNTKETRIKMRVNLDGKGNLNGNTPIPFFDHMLTHLTRYSMIDIDLQVEGDIEIDGHHTVEDTAIVFGDLLRRALAEKRGINRFGNFTLPMDEVLTQAVVDFSGRSFFVYNGPSLKELPPFGIYDSELTEEFLQKLAMSACMNLHIRVLYGENRHHIHESIFKALGLAIRQAVEIDPRRGDEIPSTKGVI